MKYRNVWKEAMEFWRENIEKLQNIIFQKVIGFAKIVESKSFKVWIIRNLWKI